MAKTFNVRMHLNDFKSQYVWMSVMSTEKLSMEMSSVRILLSLHLYVSVCVVWVCKTFEWDLCVFSILAYFKWCTMVREVLLELFKT